MAMPKLKPIEERDPYAAAVLSAFDEQEEEHQMSVGLDCCPHNVPYGSDCDECDEEDGLTPNDQGKGPAR